MKKFVLFVTVFVIITPFSIFFNHGEGATPTLQVYEVQQDSIKQKFHTYNIPLDANIQKMIWDECQKYDVSFELMLAIAKVESNFKLDAKSNMGAVGLFQLHKNITQVASRGTGIKNFDSANLEHNIKGAVFEVWRLGKYWEAKGYSKEEVFGLILLSFNRGINGTEKLIKKNYDAIYNDKYVVNVENYKQYLETEVMIID